MHTAATIPANEASNAPGSVYRVFCTPRTEIDTHTVKNTFRCTQYQRSHQSGRGVCSKLFENIQKQTCRSTGRKKSHQSQRKKFRCNAKRPGCL